MIPLPFLTIGQKLAAAALVGLLIFISGAWTGGKLVGNHWQAKEVKRLKAEKAEYDRVAGIALSIGLELAKETRQRQEDARRHRNEAQKWRNHGTVQVDCPAPGIRLVVPSAVHFDSGFVDLWNGGLCLGLPAASGACRPDGAPGGADPVTPTELLANVAENSESCNADRARLRAAQKYIMEIAK